MSNPDQTADLSVFGPLLACPFCGTAATPMRGFWGGPNRPELFSVECNACRCQIGNYTSAAEAEYAWNRRQPRP